MKTLIRPAITLFILLSLVTGLLYPLLVTSISQAVFPVQASGSLIVNVFGMGLEFELRGACQAFLFALMTSLVFVTD